MTTETHPRYAIRTRTGHMFIMDGSELCASIELAKTFFNTQMAREYIERNVLSTDALEVVHYDIRISPIAG